MLWLSATRPKFAATDDYSGLRDSPRISTHQLVRLFCTVYNVMGLFRPKRFLTVRWWLVILSRQSSSRGVRCFKITAFSQVTFRSAMEKKATEMLQICVLMFGVSDSSINPNFLESEKKRTKSDKRCLAFLCRFRKLLASSRSETSAKNI